jgi:predicted TIM-barrel fold metal-dependent hydrolase
MKKIRIYFFLKELMRLIIDAHCHIWEEKLISKEQKENLYEVAQKFHYDQSLIINGTCDRLIREMDEAGIDKTVLLALDYGDHNDYVANILKEHPDRFIGFCGIDPRRGKEAIRELERCVEELGFKGVKLWPLTGFYPDDAAFYPFYERVEELGVPILCHTGVSPPKTYMKYNRPIYVDKVAVDFPKIKFQMAHIGDPWMSEAIAVAAKNPNVYFDISAWEVAFKRVPFALFQTLAEAKMTCGVEKILFGSDWPLFAPILSLKDWVEGIKTMKLPMPFKRMMGIPEFTEEEKKMILGGNAKKVLGL